VSAPQILRPDYSRLLLYSNCCCCCWPCVVESFVLIITTIRSDHRTPCTVMLVSFATYTRRQLKIREFHFPNLPLFKQVSKLIWRRAASSPHTHICSCTHLPCARPQFSEDMASWYPPMGTQGGQFFFWETMRCLAVSAIGSNVAEGTPRSDRQYAIGWRVSNFCIYLLTLVLQVRPSLVDTSVNSTVSINSTQITDGCGVVQLLCFRCLTPLSPTLLKTTGLIYRQRQSAWSEATWQLV